MDSHFRHQLLPGVRNPIWVAVHQSARLVLRRTHEVETVVHCLYVLARIELLVQNSRRSRKYVNKSALLEGWTLTYGHFLRQVLKLSHYSQ